MGYITAKIKVSKIDLRGFNVIFNTFLYFSIRTPPWMWPQGRMTMKYTL